jgi:hypothetical protein
VSFSQRCSLSAWFSDAQRSPRNRGAAGTPQQNGKGSEERASERQQHPLKDGAPASVSPVKTNGLANTQHTKENKSEDIHAQNTRIQESSPTTDWPMFWVAFGQLVAGGFGIYFIWATLRETRRAVAEASRSSEAARTAIQKAEELGDESVRPWLSVKCFLKKGECVASNTKAGERVVVATIICIVENHGASPATNVSFNVQMAVRKPTVMGDRETARDKYCETVKLHPGHGADAVFPRQKKRIRGAAAVYRSEIDAYEEDSFCLFVYGCVQYHSQHTQGVRQTRFAYDLGYGCDGVLAGIPKQPPAEILNKLNGRLVVLNDAPLIFAD